MPGARLKALRELWGWSQRELAKRAGVPNSAISVIEQGSVSPSIESLRKVLRPFSLSLSDFFSLDLETDERQVGGSGDSEFKLLVEAGATGGDTLPRVSSQVLLIIMLEGAATIKVPAQDKSLEAGELLSIPPGVPHKIVASSELSKWLILEKPAGADLGISPDS